MGAKSQPGNPGLGSHPRLWLPGLGGGALPGLSFFLVKGGG